MSRGGLMALVLGLAMMSPLAFGQAQPGGGGNNGGGNQGGRRGFDPAQMRERYMTYMKEQLGVSDDEWKVLSPKLEKVSNASRDLRGGFGGGRGPGGGRDGGGDQPTTPVAKASADLRAALEKKDTPAEEIAKKLAELRAAREKAKTELAAAQKELKELLTQRQEAVLVQMRLLD